MKTCPEDIETCRRILCEWMLQEWTQTWRRNWISSTCTAAPAAICNSL